jgi:hypothetical protein
VQLVHDGDRHHRQLSHDVAARGRRGGGAAGAATVTDSVGTLSHDVVGTVAPVVEAAVQPVLATVTDAVGTLNHDVAGTVAPVVRRRAAGAGDGDR